MNDRKSQNTANDVANAFSPVAPALNYLVDAAQRSVLFWDVMGKRANQYREHLAKEAPHVLDYATEVVMDGRTLDRPVNYVLVRVIPPTDATVSQNRRPFVVVDPRAGHGPGSGALRQTARSASLLRPDIPVISSASCQNPCPDRQSKISRARKRSSSKK
jgi:Protein of unknown function (DUF3141)